MTYPLLELLCEGPPHRGGDSPRVAPLRIVSAGSGARHASDDISVQQVHVGDEEGFGVLYRAHVTGLCAFASTIVHEPQTAEDVVNAVFARIWEQRSAWSPHAGVRAYLYGAVRNECLKVLRSERSARARQTRMAGEPQAPGMGIPASMTDKEERAHVRTLVWRAIDELPATARAVLTLRWRSGLSWEEIAAVLVMSVAAVRKQHSRALATLRAELPTFLR